LEGCGSAEARAGSAAGSSAEQGRVVVAAALDHERAELSARRLDADVTWPVAIFTWPGN
jgi:hypothetical protein